MVRRHNRAKSKVLNHSLLKEEENLYSADFSSVSGPVPNIIVFSQISERDGAALLRSIASTLQERHTPIQYLIISTYDQRLDGTNDAGECIRRGLQIFTFLNHICIDRCFRHTPTDQPFSTEMQERYFDAWKSVSPDTQTAFEPTVEGALELARSFDRGEDMHTLVTGSLYLVGAALRILEPDV